MSRTAGDDNHSATSRSEGLSVGAYHPYPSRQQSQQNRKTQALLFVNTTPSPNYSKNIDETQANIAFMPQKPKRKRISSAQLEVLTREFEKSESPSFNVRQELGEMLNMTNREVQVWFQNRRAKMSRLNASAQQALASGPGVGVYQAFSSQPDPMMSTVSTVSGDAHMSTSRLWVPRSTNLSAPVDPPAVFQAWEFDPEIIFEQENPPAFARQHRPRPQSENITESYGFSKPGIRDRSYMTPSLSLQCNSLKDSASPSSTRWSLSSSLSSIGSEEISASEGTVGSSKSSICSSFSGFSRLDLASPYSPPKMTNWPHTPETGSNDSQLSLVLENKNMLLPPIRRTRRAGHLRSQSEGTQLPSLASVLHHIEALRKLDPYDTSMESYPRAIESQMSPTPEGLELNTRRANPATYRHSLPYPPTVPRSQYGKYI